MLGTSHEILKTMSRVFARVVPGIIKEMQVHVPRSGVEQHLHDLLASMQFLTPIPAIKVGDCHTVHHTGSSCLLLGSGPA